MLAKGVFETIREIRTKAVATRKVAGLRILRNTRERCEREKGKECWGNVYFGSADDVLSFGRESLFLHASSALPSLFEHNDGEQSVVQVEKSAPAMAEHVACW